MKLSWSGWDYHCFYRKRILYRTHRPPHSRPVPPKYVKRRGELGRTLSFRGCPGSSRQSTPRLSVSWNRGVSHYGSFFSFIWPDTGHTPYHSMYPCPSKNSSKSREIQRRVRGVTGRRVRPCTSPSTFVDPKSSVLLESRLRSSCTPVCGTKDGGGGLRGVGVRRF